MKKKVILLLQLLLVIVIAFCLYKIAIYYKSERDFKASQDEYLDEAKETRDELEAILKDNDNDDNLDGVETMSVADKLKESYDAIDEESGTEKDGSLAGVKAGKTPKELINALAKKYKHIIGRIIVDGTEIDFPIVQGTDNTFYLNHGYKDEYNLLGAVFMDARNANDFTDFNSIIYGHNVRSGHIFHDLDKLKDEDFVKAHPYIIVDTLEERHVYEVVAVYTAGAYEDYRSPSYSDEAYEALLERIKEKNLLQKQMPEGEFKMLTLSTCSDVDDRLAIHAIEIK